jgi:hypothetical protein
MHVVLLTDLFLPGISGMITSIVTLAEQLVCGGHDVTLVCPESQAARRWAGQCGVRLQTVPGLTIPAGIGQRLGFPTPRTSSHLRDLLRHADILHLHSPFLIGLPAVRVAREERVPVVFTNHVLPANLAGVNPGHPSIKDRNLGMS